jgi:hypothetical protein
MGGGKAKKVRVPVYPAITGPMVSQMVARANQASQNVGVPTLAELFPYMNQNPFLGMQQGTIPTNNMMGAGRFLGQGMTDMSQAPTNMPFMPQMPMYGYTKSQYTSNPMNSVMPTATNQQYNSNNPYPFAQLFSQMPLPAELSSNPFITGSPAATNKE